MDKNIINTVTKTYGLNTKNESVVMCYSVTILNSNLVKSVPLNEANTDYQAIQEWIADGGTVIDNPPE